MVANQKKSLGNLKLAAETLYHPVQAARANCVPGLKYSPLELFFFCHFGVNKSKAYRQKKNLQNRMNQTGHHWGPNMKPWGPPITPSFTRASCEPGPGRAGRAPVGPGWPPARPGRIHRSDGAGPLGRRPERVASSHISQTSAAHATMLPTLPMPPSGRQRAQLYVKPVRSLD